MSARKPLYTGEFVAFSPFDRLALRTLIRKVPRHPCRMLEVGSWLGNGSTQVFIEELAGSGSSLICVDTWRGNPNVERHQRLVSEFDVFGTFLANVESAGPVVQPLRMTSRDAAGVLADGRFELLFIDADHSYDAVREDIANWKSKVVPGGILCGHDCEARVAEIGIDRLQAHRHEDTCEGTEKFSRIHPGSILAVHEAFGDRVNLFAESQLTLSDGTPGYSTIWWVTV